MNVKFHGDALDEIREAHDFYEDQKRGLGGEFAIEVANAIDKAAQAPDAWPMLSRRVRRCPTGRFPYGVLYTKRGDTITVIAVMHLHRRPGYWKSRLP